MNDNLKGGWGWGVEGTESQWESVQSVKTSLSLSNPSGLLAVLKEGNQTHGSLASTPIWEWMSFIISELVPFAGMAIYANDRTSHVEGWAQEYQPLCTWRRGEGIVGSTWHTFQDPTGPLKYPRHWSDRVHNIGCWSQKSVCILESATLLPKWAATATEFQFRILHLLNIGRYPGEEV